MQMKTAKSVRKSLFFLKRSNLDVDITVPFSVTVQFPLGVMLKRTFSLQLDILKKFNLMSFTILNFHVFSKREQRACSTFYRSIHKKRQREEGLFLLGTPLDTVLDKSEETLRREAL
ncbi:hypothetical protein TNCV_4331571 [Trichonephila clavipes]|nr:hypothetical protein TNCV_4331571 [Trichonephila clavipes]